MSGRVSVFQKVVLDKKTRGSDCRTQEHWLASFQKSNLTLERQERLLEAAIGEADFAAMRGILIKLFPDSIICEEQRSIADRRSQPIADRQEGDCDRYRLFAPRDGRTRRCTVCGTEDHEDENIGALPSPT